MCLFFRPILKPCFVNTNPMPHSITLEVFAEYVSILRLIWQHPEPNWNLMELLWETTWFIATSYKWVYIINLFPPKNEFLREKDLQIFKRVQQVCSSFFDYNIFSTKIDWKKNEKTSRSTCLQSFKTQWNFPKGKRTLNQIIHCKHF